MKNLIKKTILSLLVICMTLTCISTEAETVYATKKIPLKVTFCGKSVNLIKDIPTSDGRSDSPKLKTLKEKWGKPKKEKDSSYGITSYIWKKGKTSIIVSDNDVEKGGIGHISVEIGDKNGAMFGVKVGMKKNKVLKKMQKMFGKKNVTICKEGQVIKYDDDGNWTATGKPESDTEYISVSTTYQFMFIAEDGKITSMNFSRS